MKDALKYLVLTALAVTILAGCEDEDDNLPPPSPPGNVWDVQILADDTHPIVPGDSVGIPVTIVVTDRAGNVLPGRVVGVSLTNYSLARLEYVNPSMGDTTDAFGRLRFVLILNTQAGRDTIFAVCEGIHADPHPIVITTLPAALCAVYVSWSHSDSAQVYVCVLDPHGDGVPNIEIPFWTRSESIPAPPTGIDGCTGVWWVPEPPDTCLFWSCDNHVDSTCTHPSM